MPKIKTKETIAKTHSVNGELRVLSEAEGWLQKVELWLLNSDTNRNNWRYMNLDEHRGLFAETPILCAYVGDKIGDSHNFDEVRGKDGSIRASFMAATAERIVGYFKSDADIRIVDRDGKNWIVGTGYIWRWYASELVDKLKVQGLDGMSVSIETLIDEGHFEGDTEVFTKYQILGTTILGDGVQPAVADANIRVLAKLGADEVRKMTLRVASAEESKNKNPQKNTNKGVKTMAKISDVQAKLDGYKVLCVSGDNAVFTDDKHEIYTCAATVENGETVIGAKMPVDKFSIAVNGENIEVDCATVLGHMNAELNKAHLDYDAEHEARVNAEAKLEKMEKAENERRKAVVLSAIDKRFAEINEIRAEAIEASTVEALKADERVCAYSAMEDAEGKFCGDTVAMHDVDSACMEKILATATRVNSAKKFAWDIDGVAHTATKNGVDSSIDNILKN